MIGLDIHIEKVRSKIDSFFAYANDFNAKGRAYVVNRENGDIPAVLKSETTQYEDVLLDSNISGTCFFVSSNPHNVNSSLITSNVSVYFSVNLEKLYSSITTERANEYFKKDIIDLLKYGMFTLTSITEGLEAYSSFDLVKASDNMQPFYLVRFDTEIEYNINEC